MSNEITHNHAAKLYGIKTFRRERRCPICGKLNYVRQLRSHKCLACCVREGKELANQRF